MKYVFEYNEINNCSECPFLLLSGINNWSCSITNKTTAIEDQKMGVSDARLALANLNLYCPLRIAKENDTDYLQTMWYKLKSILKRIEKFEIKQRDQIAALKDVPFAEDIGLWKIISFRSVLNIMEGLEEGEDVEETFQIPE